MPKNSLPFVQLYLIIIPILLHVAFKMYICICNAVTERDIRNCAELGCSLDDLRERLGVCTGCGKCKHAAKQILHEVRAASGDSPAMRPA